MGVPLAHAALLLGYFRFSIRQTEPLRGVERWVKVIYPFGLVLLPATYILQSLFSAQLPGAITPPLWPGILLAAVVLVVGVLYWRGVSIPSRVIFRLDQIFSLNWFYPLLGWIYQVLGRMIRLVSLLLEGEGGMLWALVILVLLVSILSQVAAGTGAM
jgi:hypothetical protein